MGSFLTGRTRPVAIETAFTRRLQMVLGHAQCQMAFYVQQKAFELPRPRPNQPAHDPGRPANVRCP